PVLPSLLPSTTHSIPQLVSITLCSFSLFLFPRHPPSRSFSFWPYLCPSHSLSLLSSSSLPLLHSLPLPLPPSLSPSFPPLPLPPPLPPPPPLPALFSPRL